MEVVCDPPAFRRELERARAAGRRVGLVPTMGALHAGHLSLVSRAAAERPHVAVSIFVNPRQFDRLEDLSQYPRDLEADLRVCEDAGVATVFTPSEEGMFPAGSATTVSVGGLGDRWEGASRRGHFDGVATVVAKLFSLAGPCAAYFGEKDFQQLALVRRMAADLSLPVEVVACPTVRDADGLALSSRNVRLSRAERSAAPVLWRALRAGRAAVADGVERPEAVVDVMSDVVESEPLARLDYAAAVDDTDLTVPESCSKPAALRLLLAVEVGPVRLIDNCDAPRPAEPAVRGAELPRSRAAAPAY
ncbi:MAG TPA: pantoate--beta-alanine ligase [Acidimicrobiales bacterium]|nr:pantoate--beta-alanine ligase [Acidimicrobiales bacterium]